MMMMDPPCLKLTPSIPGHSGIQPDRLGKHADVGASHSRDTYCGPFPTISIDCMIFGASGGPFIHVHESPLVSGEDFLLMLDMPAFTERENMSSTCREMSLKVVIFRKVVVPPHLPTLVKEQRGPGDEESHGQTTLKTSSRLHGNPRKRRE